MNEFVVALGWAGVYGAMALAAMGSIIGCAVAGQAAIGAMLETESGYGRYLGISVMPSSQVIYGIVVMFTLNRPVTAETGGALFGIGILAGLALMVSAIRQGQCLRLGHQRGQGQAGNLRSGSDPGGGGRGLRGLRLRLRPGPGRGYPGGRLTRNSVRK